MEVRMAKRKKRKKAGKRRTVRRASARKAPRRRRKSGGGKADIKNVGKVFKSSIDEILVAGASIIGARAINGLLSRDVDPVTGVIYQKPGANYVGIAAALLGIPAVLALLKQKKSIVVASMVGSGAGVLSDVLGPIVSEQLAPQAAQSPMLAKAITGIASPVSYGGAPMLPAAMPTADAVSYFGDMFPDATIGDMFPDATIDDGFGDTYMYD
jgi:hypothetical protein